MPTSNDTTKRCSKCKQELSGKRCKSCKALYDKQRYAANSEKIKEQSRQHYQRNKAKIKVWGRNYYQENKEAINTRNAEYVRNNPGIKKSIEKRYRQRHPDKCNESNQRWLNNHPEKKREYSIRRKAREHNAEGDFTANDIQSLYTAQSGKCWWCECELDGKYEIDHRVPLSRGGTNYPNNLCLTCRACNRSKNDKLPHEWNGRLL